MEKPFSVLFVLSDDEKSYSPRRSLRLGGVIMPPELVLPLGEPYMGLDIALWVGKTFDVIEDGDVWIINRIQ